MSTLELGARKALLVREERFGPAAGQAWRLLFASDLHLTARRGHVAAAVLETVRSSRPDRVLLGGDLVDSASGTSVLCALVRAMVAIAPVRAVPGNHDAGVGLESVRAALLAGGGSWLGAEVLSHAGRPALAIATRLEPATDRVARRLLLAHDPAVFPHAVAAGFDIVLAGHLHGCQCVLWRRGGRLYPGAFFYRWNGLRFTRGASAMVVSRGVADTLPVRYRCPREVVLCEVG
jgi:predicted MPP superfamily phosphohydrolase